MYISSSLYITIANLIAYIFIYIHTYVPSSIEYWQYLSLSFLKAKNYSIHADLTSGSGSIYISKSCDKRLKSTIYIYMCPWSFRQRLFYVSEDELALVNI